jgi:uncharacterized protein YjiS (DUF1127 family)
MAVKRTIQLLSNNRRAGMFINETTEETEIRSPLTQAMRQSLLDLLRLIFVTWPERSRQRRHLDALPDHYLRDIGLTRSQARREASRWFFD